MYDVLSARVCAPNPCLVPEELNPSATSAPQSQSLNLSSPKLGILKGSIGTLFLSVSLLPDCYEGNRPSLPYISAMMSIPSNSQANTYCSPKTMS